MLQAAVIVADIKPRKDKSWKIAFETRELSGEDVNLLVDHLQGEGWLQFSANEDMPAPPASPADAGTKSPSERLRSHVYVLWSQRGEKGSFDSFWAAQVDAMCERLREMIDKEKDV